MASAFLPGEDARWEPDPCCLRHCCLLRRYRSHDTCSGADKLALTSDEQCKAQVKIGGVRLAGFKQARLGTSIFILKAPSACCIIRPCAIQCSPHKAFNLYQFALAHFAFEAASHRLLPKDVCSKFRPVRFFVDRWPL